MMHYLKKPNFYEITLFIAILSGPPKFRARDPFATFSGQIDWSVMLNFAVWFLGALWVFYHIWRLFIIGKVSPKFTNEQKVSFLFLFFLSLSSIVSPSPSLTLYRVFQIWIMLLFGWLWIRRFGLWDTLIRLMTGYVILAFSIAICAIWFPDLVGSAGIRIRGDLITDTGSVAVLGIVVLFCSRFHSPIFKYILLLLFAALLVLARTRVAYLAFLVFFVFYILRIPKADYIFKNLYLLGIIGLFVIAFQSGDEIWSWVIRDQSTVQTFSDRLPMWTYLLEYLGASPWVGFGFSAERAYTLTYNQGLGTAHSSYISILFGGGFLSFVPFCIVLFSIITEAAGILFREGKDPVTFTWIGLLFASLTLGFSTDEIVLASPVAMTFWILVTAIPMLSRKNVLSFEYHNLLKGGNLTISKDESYTGS